MLLNVPAAATASGPEPIEIPSALVKLIEQVDVPASEAGLLAAVNVREGQMVTEGGLLAQITDVEAQLDQQRAQLELAVAQKNAQNDVHVRFARKSVEVAQAELGRAQASVEKYAKSISDSEMDRLRLVVERSVLDVEQAEHEFAIARLTRQIKENECQTAREKVRRHRITAPLAGIVVQVARHGGEWVRPGDTVVRVLRLDRLRAEGFVKLAALQRDPLGYPVKLIVDLPGAGIVNSGAAEFDGKVVFVNPEVDPVNAQVRVWAEVENRQLRLRPGMRARMLIESR